MIPPPEKAPRAPTTKKVGKKKNNAPKADIVHFTSSEKTISGEGINVGVSDGNVTSVSSGSSFNLTNRQLSENN
jgi:hypothetical protein